MSRIPAAPLRAPTVLAGILIAGLALSGPGVAQEAPNGAATSVPAVATAASDGNGEPAADTPECQWAGERILSLLWRDDIRTATDFLDLYDRFQCPPEHVALAFRCLVKVGVVPEQAEPGLPQRTRACWADPNLDPASLKPETAVPQTGQPQGGETPASPPTGGDAASQGEAQKPAEAPATPQ